MESSVPDSIKKSIQLNAPLNRVWRAISDSRQFGIWFGVEFNGPFLAGQRLKGRMVPTKVDAEVAKAQESFAGVPVEISVERIEPEHHFSFRWHPMSEDEGGEFDAAPSTLVSFELTENSEGTHLALTESGFSKIPLEKRAQAFAQNEGGWAIQMQLIQKYLLSHA